MAEELDLVIPVYVDTNALLDLLASVEGGFSVVDKITTQSADTRGIDRSVKAETGTEFGIPNVLSLLKLNIGYSANWKKAKNESQQTETERYHTYGSLFYRLREFLDANSLIRRWDESHGSWERIRPADFVEIRGVFRPNPLASSLEIIDRLVGIVQLVGSGSAFQQQPRGKSTPDGQQKREAQNQTKQMAAARSFIQGVVRDLQAGDIRTFVIDLSGQPGRKVVTLLYLSYLRDQTMSEIRYREYRLLGKVVRKIEAGSSEHVDLLLGSAMGGLGKATLGELVSALGQLPNMSLPEVETEVVGPALEVVPVAVYV